MRDKLVHRFIIGTFVSLYLLVSVISTIHVIDFFKLSNPYWLAVSLAIGFEIGAAASLASLIILDKMNKGLVWALFGTITLMQMQGNMYYAFVNMEDFQGWSELFGLIEEDVVYQKRALAAVSGAILPLVALGFIKSLVDYIKPSKEKEELATDLSEGEKLDSLDVEEMQESIKEEKNLDESLLYKEEIVDNVIPDSFEESIIPEEENYIDEEIESYPIIEEDPSDIETEFSVEELFLVDLQHEPELAEPELAEPKFTGEIPSNLESMSETLEFLTEEITEVSLEGSDFLDPEVSSPLAEEEISAIMDEPSPEEETPKSVVSGYYGDIVIDGNGIHRQENSVLPVNSNKKSGLIDQSGKVYINPTRL